MGTCTGILQVWANGQLVIDVQCLEIRVEPDVVFRGAHFQTFFGGAFHSGDGRRGTRLTT